MEELDVSTIIWIFDHHLKVERLLQGSNSAYKCNYKYATDGKAEALF